MVTVAHEADLGCHQGEIGHGSGNQELEEGLGSPEVASLAHAKLHQPRQSVLSDLP